MRREDRFFTVLAIVGGFFLFGNWLFIQYDWYPNALKEVAEIREGVIWGVMLPLAAFAGHMAWQKFRSLSPVVTADFHRFSWNPVQDQPLPAGPDVIVSTDGIAAGGILMRGRGPLIVTHRDGCQQIGNNLRIHGPLREWKLEELPPLARKVIRKKRWTKRQILFCYAPTFIEQRTRDYSKQIRQMATNNRDSDIDESSHLRAMRIMDQRLQVVQGAVEDAGLSESARKIRELKRAIGFDDRPRDEVDE